MKTLIINGSPRKNGNTSELVNRFIEKIKNESDVKMINIYDMNLKGCMNCNACQEDVLEDHCTIKDDMSKLYPEFIGSEVVVLASPIYMWQLTPCMSAFINRLYPLCQLGKSYNVMKGKKIAVLTTMAAEEDAADFAIDPIKNVCEYYQMELKGDLRIPLATKERISSGEFDKKITDLVTELLN